jgi:GNAT superfamily N-acetyltransferase
MVEWPASRVALTFSELSADDAYARIRDLRLRGFPEIIGTEADSEAFFRWKFGQWPSHLYAATSETGDPVGLYGANILRYLAGAKEVRVALIVDVMTDPRARKQGIFTQLGRFALESLKQKGYDFSLGYPIRPEVIPGHLKVGWQIAKELPVYVSPVHLHKAMSFLPRTLAGAFEAAGAMAARVLTFTTAALHRTQASSVQVVSTQQLLDRPDFSEFLERARAGLRFACSEGPDFYRWRYGAPHRPFQHITAEVDGRLCLAISMRPMTMKGLFAMGIADVKVTPAARALLPAAWQCVWRLAWEKQCSVLAMMAAAESYFPWRLGSLPVVRTPVRFKLIARELNGPLPSFHGDGVRLTWADTDDV